MPYRWTGRKSNTTNVSTPLNVHLHVVTMANFVMFVLLQKSHFLWFPCFTSKCANTPSPNSEQAQTPPPPDLARPPSRAPPPPRRPVPAAPGPPDPPTGRGRPCPGSGPAVPSPRLSGHPRPTATILSGPSQVPPPALTVAWRLRILSSVEQDLGSPVPRTPLPNQPPLPRPPRAQHNVLEGRRKKEGETEGGGKGHRPGEGPLWKPGKRRRHWVTSLPAGTPQPWPIWLTARWSHRRGLSPLGMWAPWETDRAAGPPWPPRPRALQRQHPQGSRWAPSGPAARPVAPRAVPPSRRRAHSQRSANAPDPAHPGPRPGVRSLVGVVGTAGLWGAEAWAGEVCPGPGGGLYSRPGVTSPPGSVWPWTAGGQGVPRAAVPGTSPEPPSCGSRWPGLLPGSGGSSRLCSRLPQL